MENKNIGYYTTEECIDIIYEYDELITKLSNQYFIPKAAIQAILLRELRCYYVADDIADTLVIQQFYYLQQVEEYNDSPWWLQLLMGYPEMPIPYKEDSSVGLGQIFSATAIDANNWAVENGIINGVIYDFSNWKDREIVWTRLKDDNEYNIGMIALVLLWGVDDRGFGTEYYRYDETKMKKMLAIYNGDDSYGDEVYNCFVIFDNYN